MAAIAKPPVLDASVALKWALRDEEAAAQADALLADLVAERIAVLVPSLFGYEIINALKAAVVQQRLSEAKARQVLDDFQSYRIERLPVVPVRHTVLELSLKHGRSAYDSAYLALAQSRGLWLFTGDKRLFNAVGSALQWVKWIGDYRLDAIPSAGEAEASRGTG